MFRAWRTIGRTCIRGSSSLAPSLAVSCCLGKHSTCQRRAPLACESPGKTTDTSKLDTDNEKSFWLAGSSAGGDGVFAAKYDLYGGVIIDADVVPKDEHVFRSVMKSSLAEWTRLEKRGVWLQLRIDLAALIPIATAEFGFEFHSAERSHVMLTKWLPTNAPNTLPANASHTVGVGAIVTDKDGRVLLVREKSGPAARLGIWKLPTGLVDAGEELHDAAVREVKEETGIDAAFEQLGAFTMSHGGNLAHAGKSNLFFIVKCKALSTEISAQKSEIAEAQWFTVEEWKAMPFPERGSIWDVLNMSALDGEVCSKAKTLPWGKKRPDLFKWVYYPSSRF